MRLNSGIAAALAMLFLAGGCSKQNIDHVQQGKAFQEKGDLPAAVIEFKNAVQASGESLDARLLLAEAEERAGDAIAAEQQYRKALNLGGNADDLVPRIAALMLDRGDVVALSREFGDRQLALPSADSQLRGIVAIAELIQRHKDAAERQLSHAETETPVIRLARVYLPIQAQRVDEARKQLDELLKDGQAPWWLLRQSSRVYAMLGDRPDTLATLAKAYELAGDHAGIVAEYAEQLIEAGRMADAKPLREKLHKIAPRSVQTAMIDALFQLVDGQMDQAHDSVAKVLAAAPDFVPAQLLAARLELDRDEKELAENHLQKVLAKNPGSVAALRMQFSLELGRGDIGAASATLASALAAAPNDRNLLAASANLAWAKGDKAGALQQMTKATQAQPPKAELLARLAEMQAALGRPAEAAKNIAQAIELSAGIANARETDFRTVLRMHLADKAKELAKAEMSRRPGDAGPLLWMAAALANEGNRTGALDQVRRALDTRPDSYGALMVFQTLVAKPDELKEYDVRLQKAVDGGAKDVRIYLEMARRLSRSGADANRIAAMLERGANIDPKSVRMRELAIGQWLAAGNKEKALAMATAGEAAMPGSAEMEGLAAATLEAVDKPEQAAVKYGDLDARYPERPEWSLKQAQALVRAGKAPDAISLLRRVIAKSPNEPPAYHMLTAILLDQKQNTEAVAVANSLVDRPKRRAAGLLLLGDTQLRLQARDEAMKAYEEARKAGAEEDAALRIMQLKASSGDEGAAAAELRNWLATHPDSIPALRIAAAREVTKSDYAGAARYLETIVKLRPADVAALNDLAWSYAQIGNPAALAMAKRALALAPKTPVVLDTMAETQVKAGQKDEAMANLRFALSLAPGNASVRVHLAELLLAKGDKKEAADLLAPVDAKALDRDGKRRFDEARKRL